MRRRFGLFLGMLILTAAWGEAVRAADEWGTITIPAGKPVKIALGAMLTGDYASLGLDIRNGARMAVEEKKSLAGHTIEIQAEDFGKNVTALGGKVLASEGITRGDKDFSPVLTKIKPLKPELLYYGGMAAEGVLIVRQMKRAGFGKTVFMSDDGCYTEKDFIQAGGTASTGAYVTYAREPDPAWVKRFESRYGPRQTFSPQAFDATNILMAAVEKVARKQADGSLGIGKKALRDAVAATQMDGITGKIAFDAHGDRTGSVVVIYRVVEEGGKRFFKQEDF